MADTEDVVQPIEADLLTRLGIERLNIGSGSHVARDYGDPTALYIDADQPSGHAVHHPSDPRLQLVDGRFTYFRSSVPPLLIESQSATQVISEHLIEHLTPADALAFCREVRRVLVPGGVFRISTPDLRRYVRAFEPTPDSDSFRMMRGRCLAEILPILPDNGVFLFNPDKELEALGSAGLADSIAYRPAFLINQLFRLWGHRWIYDIDEIKILLSGAGFELLTIQQSSFRRGVSPGLACWDSAYRADESMYVDAIA